MSVVQVRPLSLPPSQHAAMQRRNMKKIYLALGEKRVKAFTHAGPLTQKVKNNGAVHSYYGTGFDVLKILEFDLSDIQAKEYTPEEWLNRPR